MHFPADTVQTRTTTPFGEVALAAHSGGLAGLWFVGQRWQPAELSRPDAWPHDADHPALRQAAARLDAYFNGQLDAFKDLSLDLTGGTEFQQSVWRALASVPHGSTLTYGALAARIQAPSAVRAVGAAIGRNPLSLVLPCHRIVGASGALTGYAGGLERKRGLLVHERALA